MNQSGFIEQYIDSRLAELDQQKDLATIWQKERISFGMDSKKFSHLPAWKNLVAKKKQLISLTWLNAFVLSLTVIAISTEIWNKFQVNWIKALVYWLLMSGVIMLFYVFSSYYSLFFQFRQTEREVRKLIYQDILYQLAKEKQAIDDMA
jgi:hypothetical protein